VIDSHKNKAIEDVVILSGDHLYRMDYMQFVEAHRACDADITVGCIPCDDDRASDFGLMKIDGDGVITEFSEKPKGDALKAMQVRRRRLYLSHVSTASQHIWGWCGDPSPSPTRLV
jgi:glucose-1-phosphate adenylyltransferase